MWGIWPHDGSVIFPCVDKKLTNIIYITCKLKHFKSACLTPMTSNVFCNMHNFYRLYQNMSYLHFLSYKHETNVLGAAAALFCSWRHLELRVCVVVTVKWNLGMEVPPIHALDQSWVSLSNFYFLVNFLCNTKMNRMNVLK